MNLFSFFMLTSETKDLIGTTKDLVTGSDKKYHYESTGGLGLNLRTAVFVILMLGFALLASATANMMDQSAENSDVAESRAASAEKERLEHCRNNPWTVDC